MWPSACQGRALGLLGNTTWDRSADVASVLELNAYSKSPLRLRLISDVLVIRVTTDMLTQVEQIAASQLERVNCVLGYSGTQALGHVPSHTGEPRSTPPPPCTEDSRGGRSLRCRDPAIRNSARSRRHESCVTKDELSVPRSVSAATEEITPRKLFDISHAEVAELDVQHLTHSVAAKR